MRCVDCVLVNLPEFNELSAESFRRGRWIKKWFDSPERRWWTSPGELNAIPFTANGPLSEDIFSFQWGGIVCISSYLSQKSLRVLIMTDKERLEDPNYKTTQPVCVGRIFWSREALCLLFCRVLLPMRWEDDPHHWGLIFPSHNQQKHGTELTHLHVVFTLHYKLSWLDEVQFVGFVTEW